MALNHRKVNGVRKSSTAQVKLKALTISPGTDAPSYSARTSPRSPRRPVTETLEVDVDLADSGYSSLSPGRRCLSDSKVNTKPRTACLPPAARKRKIDFDHKQSGMISSKFYTEPCKNPAPMSGTGSNQGLDANQNNLEPAYTAVNHEEQELTDRGMNSSYKSQHLIGRRRAASSFFSYSETTLSSPWNIGKSKKKRVKRKVVEGGAHDRKRNSISESVNSDLSSETSLEQDSVFVENETVTQNGSTAPLSKKPKRSKTCKNHLKQKEGKTKKCDDDKFDAVKPGDGVVIGGDAAVISGGPRTRRLASLDAETKVHLMFERESLQAAEGEKPKRSRKQSLGKPKDYTEIQPHEKADEPVVAPIEKERSIEDHFVDHCEKDLDLMDEPAITNIPVMPQECNIAGNVTCVNCGSETPAIYVHPPPPPPLDGSCEMHKLNQLAPMALPTNRFNLMPTSHVPVSTEIGELFNDPDALMRRLSQLAQRHRTSVDSSSECNYLKVLFKHRLSLQLSEHPISEPEMERISSTLAHQLSSLIHYNRNLPLSPTLSSSATISRQKLIRKVIRPPGLKPAKEKLGRKKSTNGWKGVGDPVAKPIVYLNEFERELRYCYESIKRKEDVIRVRDCILLRSGMKKKDIPFVGKISAIFEDAETGEIMISLLWYYRPEHTECGRQPEHIEQEIFACRHWDINNVACIEDKCFVLPMSEYCRYQSELKRDMEGISPGIPVVPELPPDIRHREQPDFSNTSPENVFLCRQVYDYKQRRLLKNPACKLT